MESRLRSLAGFVEALKEALSFKFNVNRFDHRLKLQKLVYIYKALGGNLLDYEFNLYLRGPYSPELADDYYHLSNSGMMEEVGGQQKEIFLQDKIFRALVNMAKDKDGTWLEIAATLLELKKVAESLAKLGITKEDFEMELVNLTYKRKPFASKNYIKTVLEELKKYGAI